MRILVVLLALAACSKSKSEPKGDPPKAEATAATTYDFTAVAASTPGKLEITVPKDWKVEPAQGDAPTFDFPGALHAGFGALMLTMEDSIDMQYGDDAKVERTELSGGRIWITEPQLDGAHVRMFVPFEGGVLMALAILDAEGLPRIPEIRATFETIKIVTAPK